jgi:inhibitor of cysteine peptidase
MTLVPRGELTGLDRLPMLAKRFAAASPQGAQETMLGSPPRKDVWSALRMVVCRVVCLGVLLLPGGPVTSHAAETGSPHLATITLTRADNGNAVALRVGDRLVLRLEENPATGYRWAMETHDEKVVALQHLEYAPSPHAGVGGGGQRSWTFTAHKAGTDTLQLKLWRAWEGETSITRRFTVTLHVRE